MKLEDKELLVRDLSARLPYGVICHYNCVIPCGRITLEKTNERDVLKGIIPMSDGHIGFMVGIDKINAIEGDIKPYLRPMVSMTQEERKEYRIECNKVLLMRYRISNHYPVTDWLNAHHFDYRGLIPMGLALEAKEGIYKIE